MKTSYTRKSHYLSPEDEQAISTIKERYGLSSDSDAVRLALRLVAQSPLPSVKSKRTK